MINKSKRSIGIELSRDLSLFHITMLGVGMMIGAGVFVCTGIGIGISGPGGILIAFALNGLIALFCTMTYAELGSAMPEAGGGYTFVREGFGGGTAFLSGWMSWFGHAVAGSLYSIAFATYALHFFKELDLLHIAGSHAMFLEKGVAVFIALTFVYINYRGASETGLAGSIMALGQTAVLAIIGIIGVIAAVTDPSRLANFQPFLPNGWGKILVTMGFTYIGFEGYEVIAQAGEEVENPRKNIPKAIFYALLIVVSTYLLVAFAALVGVKAQGIEPWQWIGQYGATGFAKAIGMLMPFGGILVTLAAIFSSTSALNATTYSSTRVSFALGRDRYLPERLSHISKKRRIPDVALLFSASLIVIIAAALPVEDVAASADIMFLLLFLMVNLSVIKIRQEKGRELSYGYMIPFFPLIPIIAIVVQLILSIWLFDMSAIAWIATILWIGSGFIIYRTYSRYQIPIKKRKTKIIGEKSHLGTKNRRIMIPVANPQNASLLMKYATTLARAQDAEILVLSVVTVPEQTPLSEASKFVKEREGAIKEALKIAPSDIPIHSTIRYGHHVPRSIISAVKEHKADLLILGWHGKPKKRRQFALGSTVDPVIEKSLCDSLVIKPGKTEGLKPKSKILLPTTGGPHSLKAVDIVKDLIEEHEAEVTILHVLKEGETKESGERLVEKLLLPLENTPKVSAKITENEDHDLVDVIIKEGEDHDLIVIGATRSGLFEQMIFGSIPEQVAERSDKTVIMVKKYLGIRSWINRWLGS